MISTRTFGALALGQFILAGCGNSTPSQGTPGGGTAGATTSTSSTTSTTTGGNPGVCGNQAERCCSSGTLCGPGLTCSDEFCLACGPAPASSMGCVNVATTATATAAVLADAGTPDEPRMALDDDVCTSWNYGDYGSAGAYWQADLGSAYPLDELTVWPKMTPADGEVSLLLQYKVNEADAFTSYPSDAGITLTMHDYHPWQTIFSPALTARFFRITIVKTPSFAALREVGLYTSCPQ